MQARLYMRVSTDEQAASGFSLPAQKGRLEAFCISQGWTVAGYYVDDGVSAKDTNRPEFQRMLQDCIPEDVVLVYKLDRFTRSVRDLDELLRVFEKRSIYFRSATENFDTVTATGRMMMRMVGEFAQWERETIAERSTMGKRKRAESGEWSGGGIPFGYMTVPTDRVKAGRVLLDLVPDPKTSHVVPMIFDRYLSGCGIRGVCKWLNEELGMRTPRGGLFHLVTLRNMLANPVYCGDVSYGKKYGPYAKKDRFVAKGHHTPLLSREVFERVQTIFDDRKGVAPQTIAGRFLLTGIARCGICGGPISGKTRVEREHRAIYRCVNYLAGKGCGQNGGVSFTNVSQRFIDENFILELEKNLTQPEMLDRFIGACAEADSQQDGLSQIEVARLRADLQEAEAEVNQWKRLFTKQKISDEEYLTEVGPYQERVKALRTKLDEYEQLQRRLPDKAAISAEALTLVANWPWLEPSEKKVVVKEFTRQFGITPLIFPDRHVELRPSLKQPVGASPP